MTIAICTKDWAPIKYYFNFYNTTVAFETQWTELAELISRDFAAFKVNEVGSPTIILRASKQASQSIAVPAEAILRWRRKASITYDLAQVRYNDYHGKALTIFDYQKEQGELYSTHLSRAHEIAYLLILSRTGKALELQGKHKIHAMGIAHQQKAVLVAMDSGMGKSTLLTQLMERSSAYQLLSDDCPIITTKGSVRSFPLRVGLSAKSLEQKNYPASLRYELYREQYGLKQLLEVSYFNYVAMDAEYSQVALVFGSREGQEGLQPISKAKAFSKLVRPFFIGIGLPLIFEYFWQNSLADFIVKSKIAASRFVSGWRLVWQANCYQLNLSRDLEKDTQLIVELLES